MLMPTMQTTAATFSSAAHGNESTTTSNSQLTNYDSSGFFPTDEHDQMADAGNAK